MRTPIIATAFVAATSFGFVSSCALDTFPELKQLSRPECAATVADSNEMLTEHIFNQLPPGSIGSVVKWSPEASEWCAADLGVSDYGKVSASWRDFDKARAAILLISRGWTEVKGIRSRPCELSRVFEGARILTMMTPAGRLTVALTGAGLQASNGEFSDIVFKYSVDFPRPGEEFGACGPAGTVSSPGAS